MLRAPAEELTDAVLTASRVLVAVAARSLSDHEGEVSLQQYRALVMLASTGRAAPGRPRRGIGRGPINRYKALRPPCEQATSFRAVGRLATDAR